MWKQHCSLHSSPGHNTNRFSTHHLAAKMSIESGHLLKISRKQWSFCWGLSSGRTPTKIFQATINNQGHHGIWTICLDTEMGEATRFHHSRGTSLNLALLLQALQSCFLRFEASRQQGQGIRSDGKTQVMQQLVAPWICQKRQPNWWLSQLVTISSS